MNARSARFFLVVLLLAVSRIVSGAEASGPPDEGYAPPRLSHIEGQASFWRADAEDWTPARVNMPLADGDRFYTGQPAALEIQVGPRAFVRAADNTQLGLVDLEPGFLQLELRGGTTALDLRSLPAGYRVELDTPSSAFTIEHPGYYRVEVDGDETQFITRRGGRATIMVEGAPPRMILASEEIIVRGTTEPAVTTYVAPQLDAWDRWNYTRTDHEIEALSARYVSPGVYGVGALDQYGRWRVVPDYGPVWVPDGVAAGWVPYSAGSWVWDRYYGWTWVDDAPWGWAPFHYGRWVHVGGYWAWAPGPVIARPVYAPALVAFFGLASGLSVRIGIGGPGVGWVALGWGEPLRPWWGRPGFIGAPWWGGWGGPRVVNNVVVERTTVVNVNTIVYRNTRVRDAVVAVDEGRFGAGRIRGTRFTPREARELEPIREAHPVKPRPASHAAATGPAIRPPPGAAARPVVTTRPPRETPRVREQDTPAGKPRVAAPAAPPPRVVTPPKQPDATAAPSRPSLGDKGVERPRPPQPPRYEGVRRPAAAAPAPPAPQPQREPVPPRAAAPAERPSLPTAPQVTEPARQPAPPRAAAPAERPSPPTAPQVTQPARQPAPPRAAPPAERPSPATAPRVSEPARQPAPQRAVAPERPPAGTTPPAARVPDEARAAKPSQALPGRPANVAAPRRAEGAKAAPPKAVPTAPARPAPVPSPKSAAGEKAAPGKAEPRR